MKKLLSTFFVALALMSYAQQQKFTYKFISQSDSVQKKKPLEELVALVVSKDGSVFYSEDRVKSDSILKAKVQAARNSGSFNLDMRGTKMGRFAVVINKQYPSYKTTFKNKIGMTTYEFDETRKPEWKITSEKKKIGEFSAQKATTNYLGREWEAWFTTDLPIQDGPYVFYGLPGLIVQIADKDQDYTFTLEGVKNNFTIADLQVDKTIKLSYDKYKKAFQENYLNPGKDMRMLSAPVSSSGVTVTSTVVRYSENGKEISAQEMDKMNADLAKSRKISDLNPIDKDLIK